MVDAKTGRVLPEVEPERLRTAVRAVLAQQQTEMPDQAVQTDALLGRLPTAAALRASAEQAQQEEPADEAAAEYFQSLLEVGYLVASADGLAAEEREALAQLVQHATDSVVDQDALQLHFSDLDATVAALGRRERLSRAAANFDESTTRFEALGFATLVAIADGTLDPAELEVLVELGQHFALSPAQVRSVVDYVATELERRLAE